jgi:glycerophosphoryl diester phosphodiesterase
MIIGHRGNSKLFLENTLESILDAVKIGADGIEFDVYTCKTGEIILNHDETLDRFAVLNNFYLKKIWNKPIHTLSWKKIKKVDLIYKNKKYKIPRLIDVLKNKKVHSSDILINIEIKDLITGDNLKKILKNYKKDKFLITSFHSEPLYYFKNFQRGKIFYEYPITFENFTHLIVEKSLINKNLIKRAKNLNMKIFVYTVNSNKEFLKLEKFVDGIITDVSKKFVVLKLINLF